MNNLSPTKVAQLCLDSVEDARPYLNRDVIIALKEMVEEQSFSDSDRALEIAEVTLTAAALLDDELATAWAAWSKGMALKYAQKPQKARHFYRQSETIFNQHKQWLPLVELQTGLVYLLMRCGEVKDALSLADEVRIQCKKLGKESLKVLGFLEINVGILYKEQGSFQLALEANERAIQAYTELGKESGIARIKINSANICQEMDQYRQAEILYKEAQQILQRMTPDAQELYIIEFNLGLQAEKLGHYQQALHHLERARAGFIPKAHIALVDMSRAEIYNKLSLSQEALGLARNAAQFYRQEDIPNDLAQALRAQAIAWQGLDELERANECLLEAQQLFAAHSSRHNVASVDLALAELMLEDQNLEQARQFTSRLADIVEADLWPNLAGEAYLLQARILLWPIQEGELPAESTLQRAYRALQQALLYTEKHPQPRLMINIYHLLSRLYILQKRPHAAWTKLCQATAYLETMRANLLLDEFQIGLMDDQKEIYQDGLRLLQDRTLSHGASDDQAQWRVMFYLLNMAATAPLAQPQSGTDPDPDLSQQLKELRALWHWQQDKLEKALSSEESVGDSIDQDIADKRAAVAETESQIADLGRRLGIRSNWQETTISLLPEIALIDSDNVSDDSFANQFQEQADRFCGEIQQQLAAGETLLHYFVVDQQVYLLLIDSSEVCYYVLGSTDSIQQFQRNWKHHLQGIKLIFNAPQIANQVAQRILSALGQMLLEPILDRLVDVTHLYLVYPPEWHEIPFAALLTPDGYLIEHFQLTHLSSPEALVRQTRLNKESDSRSCSTDKAHPPRALILGCSEGGELPHNLSESHQVQQTLSHSGWQTKLLIEDDATLEEFYAAAPQSRLIHLATHAVFQPENPLFSWARLADGQLTVADIYHQACLLNQALVVLSACETGRGQVRGGGLLGMARALLVSGAKSLIASLWRIEDQATARLMKYFYEQISTSHTLITSYHLCQAQKRLATTQHPFFWAGFIYIGG